MVIRFLVVGGGGVVGVVVGNMILMVLCWVLVWGVGVFLIFYDFLNFGFVIGEIM